MSTALPPFFVPPQSSLLTINLALLAVLFYGIYYVLLERHLAGVLMFALMLGMWILANYIHEVFPPEYFRIGLFLHLLGWISQFAGHKFAEGRQPALFDNLFQSIVLAPLFVWIEVLFLLFNYRPTLHVCLTSDKKFTTHITHPLFFLFSFPSLSFLQHETIFFCPEKCPEKSAKEY
jgi:uncharacterized membrane protein YGL010W